MVLMVAVPKPGGCSQPLDSCKLGSGICRVLHTCSSSTAFASIAARLEPTVTNCSCTRSAEEAASPAPALSRKSLYLPHTTKLVG